jgi:hypothetical protein
MDLLFTEMEKTDVRAGPGVVWNKLNMVTKKCQVTAGCVTWGRGLSMI